MRLMSRTEREEHFKQRGDASRAGPWQGKACLLNLCESRTVVVYSHVLLDASRTLSAKIKHHHDDKVCLITAASGNVHPSMFRDKGMKTAPGF